MPSWSVLRGIEVLTRIPRLSLETTAEPDRSAYLLHNPKVVGTAEPRIEVEPGMTYNRRAWMRGILTAAGGGFAAQQLWRHGHDYVFTSQFAEVEPGKIYRGAWQKPWPMRRIVRDLHIKTVVALAHPPDHPLSIQEKALADELGFRWVHIPIVDKRDLTNNKSVSDLLEEAAAVIADPKNQPVFFHCHHGLNRASMLQIAYRTRYCGWSLEKAFEEIQHTFGLVTVAHGPDYHRMEEFYRERVLPQRQAEQSGSKLSAVKTPAESPAAIEPTRR